MHLPGLRKFKIRFFNWEYWPWQVIYFPVMLYWVWLSIKARSLFFFFSANPGIESGGLLIESKKEILDKIPDYLKPKTLFFEYPESYESVNDTITRENLHFPVIGKPDYGERGWMVEKIEDLQELKEYINRIRINFLIQEYIDYPLELGIFYYRIPGEPAGTISSVVKKQLLQVVGDGKSNLRSLMLNHPRAFLQFKKIESRHPGLMNFIPGDGEKVELVPIGNHRLGTTFLDGNDLINDQLIKVFDGIAKMIDGFYYGRFDIRCPAKEELYAGRNIKIMELNGAKSEPAHIYQPGNSLFEGYRDLFQHWNILFKIAVLNHRAGQKFPSFGDGWSAWKKYRKYKRMRK